MLLLIAFYIGIVFYEYDLGVEFSTDSFQVINSNQLITLKELKNAVDILAILMS